jgi:hypothetical protein
MTDWSVIVNLDRKVAFHMGVTEVGETRIALPVSGGFCVPPRKRHIPHMWGIQQSPSSSPSLRGASATKQSMPPQAAKWMASLRSQ